MSTPNSNILDLAISYIQADGGAEAGLRRKALTALRHLAPVWRPELAEQDPDAILASVPARGLLHGHPDLETALRAVVTLPMARRMEATCTDPAKARRKTNQYSHEARRLLRWGIAHDWPLLEEGNAVVRAPEVSDDKGPERIVIKEALADFPTGTAIQRLQAAPYRWPVRDWPAAVQAEVAAWREYLTAQPENNNQPVDSESLAVEGLQDLLRQTANGRRNGRPAVRHTTVDSWVRCLELYYGALRALKLLDETTFDIARFYALAQDNVALEAWTRYYPLRQQRARGNPKYVPAQTCYVLRALVYLVRDYYYPVHRPEQLAAWGGKVPEAELPALRHLRAVSPNVTLLGERQRVQNSIDELWLAGLKMREQARVALNPVQRACLYRNGLLLLILCYCPIRRRNICQALAGTNLVRDEGGRYRLHFEGWRMKNGAPLWRTLPERLTPYIDEWLTAPDQRAHLLSRNPAPSEEDRHILFPSRAGGRLKPTTLTTQMPLWTWAMTNGRVRVSPHATRHIVATGIANVVAERAGTSAAVRDGGRIAAAAIGDTEAVAEQFYQHVAEQIEAARGMEITEEIVSQGLLHAGIHDEAGLVHRFRARTEGLIRFLELGDDQASVLRTGLQPETSPQQFVALMTVIGLDRAEMAVCWRRLYPDRGPLPPAVGLDDAPQKGRRRGPRRAA